MKRTRKTKKAAKKRTASMPTKRRKPIMRHSKEG